MRGRAEAATPVPATFKDPITPKRRAKAETEEWQWSQKKGSSEVGSEYGEKEEQDRRRVRLRQPGLRLEREVQACGLAP